MTQSIEMEKDPTGIWIDIHIGNDESSPVLTKRFILVWPNFSCGGRTLQEYFLKYRQDITHTVSLRLSEAMKELDLDKYRQAQQKLT